MQPNASVDGEDAGVAPIRDAGQAGQVGQVGQAGQAGTAAAGATAPATAADAAVLEPVAGCSREFLQQGLDAYLDAMSRGTPDSLSLHPSVYYTENGQPETVGRGLWRSQPKLTFARSALDTQTCGSVTEAVVTDWLGEPMVLGLRLRYAMAQLIDIEVEIARRGFRAFAPENIGVMGMEDPWVVASPAGKRMSRERLLRLTRDFFSSITQPSLVPDRAPTCELRQNGVIVGGGNCMAGSASERFEQLRYPVVDETTGLVSAVGIGKGFIAMFLFKIEADALINIDFVGGAAAETTGW